MAQLTLQGFATKSITLVQPGWDLSAMTGTISWPAGPLTGTNSIHTTAAQTTFSYTPPVLTPTLIVGARVRGNNANTIFEFWSDAGSNHVRLQFDASNRLACTLGSASPLGTSAASFSNVDHYIEMKVTISDTVGTIEVRVDEAVVFNFSGDTRNAGATANIGKIVFGIQSSRDMCDIYVNDTTGATHNNYEGDLRIECLYPNAAGAVTNLTPVGVAANWDNVNEIPPSVTDYNWSATIGQRDTYAHTDSVVASGTPVVGVQTTVFALKTDTGAAAIKTIQRLAGVERLSAAQNIATGHASYGSGVQPLDPSGAAWTITNVNASEHGAEVA